MQELKTISLDGSDLTWDQIDKRAKKLNMDRSKYTQNLYQHDIKRKINTETYFFGAVLALQLFLIIILLAG